MTASVTDFNQYQRMHLDADVKNPAVLREVAGQFESLFLEILLKDMRSASLGDPIFGNSGGHDMYREMLDKQLAVEMSSHRGIGLADMLVRQLGGDGDTARRPTAGHDALAYTQPATGYGRSNLPRSAAAAAPAAGSAEPPQQAVAPWDGPDDFARAVWPHAVRAGDRLGVAPEFLLAQAALESGWGTHVAPGPQGGSSLNLFGIKAGRSWDGASIAKPTLEYRDGIAHREVAQFRAYSDLEAVFDDYAEFIGTRPRYAAVLGSGDDAARFGSALQEAGYATDPHYARKIERVAGSDFLQQIVAPLKTGAERPITHSMPRDEFL